MSEPMGSHDVVAFHLLSQEVSRHVKVAQSGQGADEVFGGYGYHQPLAGARRDAAADVFTRAFADRSHTELAEVVQPEYLCRHDVSRAQIPPSMRCCPVAKERGLFRPEHVELLRAAPNEHRTPVGYNKLWQVGLLELWLQTHGIG